MNNQITHTLQILLGLILIVLVLLQTKGTGLGSTFGGDFSFYGTKRGAEKILFNLTIIIALLFFLAALFGVFLSR